jgi:hypothetical protein
MPTERSHKRSTTVAVASEEEIRAQEVLRANKELAEYFKGRRTEREARAALKTIKAFIRDRERAEPARRRNKVAIHWKARRRRARGETVAEPAAPEGSDRSEP